MHISRTYRCRIAAATPFPKFDVLAEKRLRKIATGTQKKPTGTQKKARDRARSRKIFFRSGFCVFGLGLRVLHKISLEKSCAQESGDSACLQTPQHAAYEGENWEKNLARKIFCRQRLEAPAGKNHRIRELMKARFFRRGGYEGEIFFRRAAYEGEIFFTKGSL